MADDVIVSSAISYLIFHLKTNDIVIFFFCCCLNKKQHGFSPRSLMGGGLEADENPTLVRVPDACGRGAGVNGACDACKAQSNQGIHCPQKVSMVGGRRLEMNECFSAVA